MWKNPFSQDYNTGDIDCSIVCTHLMLQAWELGVGSCWVGYFDLTEVAKTMNIPDNEKLVAILPMGYPSEKSAPSPMHFAKKDLSQIVTHL